MTHQWWCLGVTPQVDCLQLTISL
uniref:Uncharacterized protein n=1 Tax=Ciona savignyi TaxID=51511 RepID=H2YN71_CIOSA